MAVFLFFSLHPFDLAIYYTQILKGLTATGFMVSYIQNTTLEHIFKISI